MMRTCVLCLCLLVSPNLHAMSVQERAQAAVGFFIFSVGVSGFVSTLIYGRYKDIRCAKSTDQRLCCEFTNENANFTNWLGFCNATADLKTCKDTASCASSEGYLYFPASYVYNTGWFTPSIVSASFGIALGMMVVWAVHPPLRLVDLLHKESDKDAAL